MADPGGFVPFFEMIEAFQRIIDPRSGQFFMLVRIDRFHIEQYQVGFHRGVHIQRPASVRCVQGAQPRACQIRLQDIGDVRLVFDDEHQGLQA